MSKVKKQHFVPQFYLENFTNSHGKIFAFDLRESKEFPSNVGDIAHKKFFYDYLPLDNFTNQQTIEKTFSKLEGEFAKYLRTTIEFIRAKSVPEYTETEFIDYRFALAEYILLQKLRTVEMRETFKQVNESLITHLRSIGAHNELIEQYSLGTTEEDMKRFQIFMLLSDGMENLIKSYCDRWWVFWYNETKYDFYTSDHPAIGISYSDLNPWAYEIFLPLTPKCALSLLSKKGLPQYQLWDQTIQVLDDEVNIKFYNSQVVTQCNRQVYCADGNFSLAKKMKNQNPGLGSEGKPRIEVI